MYHHQNERLFTRSPGLISEPVIPGLQEHLLIVANDSFDHAEFMTAESEIASESNRLQPKLRGIGVAINVHMRRFIWLLALSFQSRRPNCRQMKCTRVCAASRWATSPPCLRRYAGHGSSTVLPVRAFTANFGGSVHRVLMKASHEWPSQQVVRHLRGKWGADSGRNSRISVTDRRLVLTHKCPDVPHGIAGLFGPGGTR